jgi:hypothetical protein
MRGIVIPSIGAAALVLALAAPAGAIEPEAVAPAKAAGKASAGKTGKTSAGRTAKRWAEEPPPRVRIGATARYRGGGPYGFLPGVRSPRAIEIEGARRYGSDGYGVGGYGWYGSRYYGYPVGVATFYHGQWNGGSFGPCWTRTPIGMVWNCGR